jgi:hypothetical protein
MRQLKPKAKAKVKAVREKKRGGGGDQEGEEACSDLVEDCWRAVVWSRSRLICLSSLARLWLLLTPNAT